MMLVVRCGASKIEMHSFIHTSCVAVYCSKSIVKKLNLIRIWSLVPHTQNTNVPNQDKASKRNQKKTF